jgi:hypothetical protein
MRKYIVSSGFRSKVLSSCDRYKIVRELLNRAAKMSPFEKEMMVEPLDGGKEVLKLAVSYERLSY